MSEHRCSSSSSSISEAESTSTRRRSRIIKLFCPSLSKLVELVISPEGDEKVDLGFISQTFGLDPATLKLNKHLISRGADFISSSLTWKSLLSFFASRGFPTGSNDHDALIVDGKLCKSGTKRGQDPLLSDHWANHSSRYHIFGANGNTEFQDVNIIKKRKMNADNPGTPNFACGKDEDQQTTSGSGLSLKRKRTIHDVEQLKKQKLREGNSGSEARLPNVLPGIQLGYSCIRDGRKRTREQESMMTATHKTVR